MITTTDIASVQKAFPVNRRVLIASSIPFRHAKRLGTVTEVCATSHQILVKVRLDEWLFTGPVAFQPTQLIPL